LIGIDTNILVYAHDNSSPFQAEALHLLENLLAGDIVAVSEFSLREFFAVMTDGRKLRNPLSAEHARDIITDMFHSAKFYICQANRETWLNGYDLACKQQIVRYQLDDLIIALSLAQNGVEKIYTASADDFKKFDFIEPINPFVPIANRQSTIDNRVIPYGRQSIDENDVAAVCSVLRSDWLTTGPKVAEFEEALAQFVSAKYAVAVSSGTAALHTAMYAIGIGPGDEVILPPMTFVATANSVVFQGGTPVFADVDPDTLLVDPNEVEAKITPRTKAIVAVDYAGQPCDYDALRDIADRYGLFLVADACHALGAEYKGEKVGTLADLTVFSFHPVKHITTGEGGMVVTDNPEFVQKMRRFRNHGITTDHRERTEQRTWHYEMVALGYNYRITDVQCALGISQLQKFPRFLEHRQEIAKRYDEVFSGILEITPLSVRQDVFHTYHLYIIKVDFDALKIDRDRLFRNLREKGIALNVHYIPVHLHPFYMKKYRARPGLCPMAERSYERIISLPLFPAMTDDDVERVISALIEVTHIVRKSD